MKMKTQLSNRILSLVLALVMIIGMLPMTTLTAFAATASVPAVDGNHIYANGTPLYIVAGTSSGTAIYYLNGSTKVYLNSNGASGNDLSNTIVWGGYAGNTLDGDVNITMTGGKIRRINGNGSDNNTAGGYVNNVNITISGGTVTDDVNAGWRNPVKGNVNITMTGGSVGKIYGCCAFSQASVGNSHVKVHGNVNITITGGTVSQVHGSDGYNPVNGTVSGLITVPVSFLNYSTVGSDLTVSFDNLLYKSGSNYIHRGTVTIPAGVTMTVAAGETLTVPVNATLINNGTLVNNGTVTVNGVLRNNGSFVNNGTVNRNAAYISTATSGTPSVWANGSAVSGAATEYVGGKLYIYGVTGNIKATLNGKTYYGYQKAGTATELTSSYVGVTDLSGFTTQMNAYQAVTLQAAISPENTTLPQTISYEVVDAGGTGAVLSGNILNAYGGGTVKLRAKATDGYLTYTEDFSVTVSFVPVTGLSAAVPSTLGLGTYILPGAAPSNASTKTVIWSVVSAGNTGATITGNQLTIPNKGTLKIKCLVENGVAYGQDYTQEFTITAVALDYVNISTGSVTISKKDDQTLTVTYPGFNGGSKDYGVNEIIPITGTTTVNTVTVASGNPMIQITDLSIDVSNTKDTCAFSINSGANVTLILSGTNVLKSGGGYTTTGNRSEYYGAAGLRVPSGAAVTIEGTGQLTAYSKENGAGIGGSHKQSAGTITINSGTVTASSGRNGAGIGSGYVSSGGSGGTITINGGTVTATSGGNGAGIGGGADCSGGTITINGGTVIATGGFRAAGIGGGWGGNGGTVKITGGNVKVTGGAYSTAIGMGDEGRSNGTLTNGTESVSLVVLTLDGAAADTTLSAVFGVDYGVNDVKTLDTNKLYFYLPANTAATSITTGGREYVCKDNNLTYYTSHDWSNDDGICARCGEDCGHENQTGGICEICGKSLHTHQWEYTVSGTTITATCKADGCTNDDGGSVTLKANDAYFTGSAIGATVTGSFTNGATYKVTYNDSETAPSDVGTHTAKLTVYENGTEKQNVTAQYKISYLPAPTPAYTISGAYEDNGTYWFKSGAVAEVNSPYGFMISTEFGTAYGAFVYLDEGDSKTVYLKRVSDGALTDAINVEGIRFDGNGATGKITIENRGFWEKLFNKITFGLFFKGDAVAKVSATDVDSGWKSIQYYVANEDLINDGDASILETAIGNNWKDYSDEIALNKNAKNIIYVKITDNVGNVTYISSEGIVIYSDAEAVTESVSTTYKAGTDKDVTVKLNGHTVNAIKNGDEVLSAGADYTVSADGTITLKADYLDTLNAGTYTFTVSYNPLGETFVAAPSNDAPKATTFKVVIEKADGKVSNINISGKTYDGTAVTVPTFDRLGDGAATIEYKVKGADDSTYTTTAPNAAEDYIVRVTVAEGANYKAASATAEFTISRATLKDISVQQNGKLTYDGGKALTPAVTANATALNGAEVLFMYSADGTSYGSMPTFTDAGTYTVHYCAYTTDNNFIDQYGTFTVTIDKANVTEPTIASKPFNNSAQKADISDTDLYTVVKNNGGTAKGSYDVVLKLKDRANYKWSTTDNEEVTLQFVISTAQNSWDTKPTISGWTYGETPNAPTYKAKFGTVKVVYSGKANDGTDYNSDTAPTKAGSYTATFTVDGTEDYSGLSEQVNFTVAKKAVTVTANDASKTYGDSDPALTYSHTELVGSDALVITVARASGENANTYTITASQAEGANPNYELTFKTGTFTIRKAALTVTVEDKTATYGDTVPTYTVKYDGFKNGDDKDDLGGTLAFACDYAQFSDKDEYTVKASGYTSRNYTITYVDGKLNVSAKPITITIQNATSIYGEALAELKATDNGIVNNDKDVYSLATVATSTSNVGKYAITGTALDSNYTITFVNGEYEITKREITITVEAKNTIVNTTLPTYTYKVEGLVGEDKLETEPTLTSDADITVIGEYDITATGADAGGNYSIKYVPAKLTVLTDNAVDAAAGYTEELKDYDPATVTSADKAELDEILNEINTILEDENITDNGKKALEEVKEQVEKLIKEITDAVDATDTENVGKVENVTPENVTPENKTDLEGAKADLEKALEDHGSNMTEDEKKAVEDEIKRIDDALEVIGNVEAVEELIDKLPDTIKKDDEAAIKAADDAYNALSDYEKSLVNADVKKALDDAKAALAGLNKLADSTSPDTGDNSNMFLWIALLFISGGAVITLTVVDRKRKAVKR